MNKTKIIENGIPTDAEIEEIRIKRILDKAKKSIKEDDLEKYIGVIRNNSSKDISSEEIAAGLLKMVKREN